VLSDILSKQGEQTLAHLGTQLDASSGRILARWEIRNAKLQRQLAAYTYDEHGDLVQAQDENCANWHYQYQSHLVTRYTDRTGQIDTNWGNLVDGLPPSRQSTLQAVPKHCPRGSSLKSPNGRLVA